jgi:lipopolysaccharide export system protein LptC
MSRVITAQTDDETARSYWTMNRGDSERAFRAARRHSRAVRVMRLAVPAGVVVVLLGFGLAAYFNPLRALTKLPVNLSDLVVSGTKITMEKPRMTGFTKDGRSYEFVADAAAQDLTKPDIVELRNIRAKLQMQDQSVTDMSADTGVYDTKREMLQLNNNIVLLSSNGNKGRLSQALIDVRKGNVVSDQPVELEFLQGVLNAKQLEIVDSGDLIRFHGGVDMMLMLNNTALPKPGAAPQAKSPPSPSPRTEAPMPAAPKAEVRRVEVKRAEASRAEIARAEAPKARMPIDLAPRTETSRKDSSKPAASQR